MRTIVLLAGALLALLSPSALAGGVGLSWGPGCWADGNPIVLLTSACNSNAGSATLTASFTPDVDIEVAEFEVALKARSAYAVAPWWEMGPGQCRAAALSASADFTLAPQVGCLDAWQNLAAGGVTSYVTEGVEGKISLTAHYTLATPVMLYADVECYACRFTFDYGKTVGADSCAGCPRGLVWSVCSVTLVEPGGGRTSLEEWVDGGIDCVVWQELDGLPCNVEVTPCYTRGLPVRGSTWGQLKSLYR